MDVFARLNDPSRSFVVAEIGSNHDGSFERALRLMDAAARAGADAVKFQSFLAEHLVRRDSADFELLKRLELPRDWYPRLKSEASARGMVFFSTATNEVTLGWLQENDVELYKIASPNISHIPLIARVASIGKPAIMSTGMADLAGIDEAVSAFVGGGNRRLCLLHCVSQYPAPPEAINLRFIATLRGLYPFPIGFSDHTLDLATSIAAVALGATVIEKHLTLDRAARGPDHHYALEPGEFAAMTRAIRTVNAALGASHKTFTPAERELARNARRSLHAARSLRAGSRIAEKDVVVIRPDDGLHPRHLGDVLEMTLQHDVEEGAPLGWHLFKG